MDVLEWTHFYLPADPRLFRTDNYLRRRGVRGVGEECYRNDENSRQYLSPQTMKRPMDYLKDYMIEPNVQGGSPRFFTQIESNDFAASNDGAGLGELLSGTFAPEEIGLVPEVWRNVSAFTGALSSDKPSTTPCIKLKDVESRLPECEKPHPDTVLKREHCEDAYDQGLALIREFADPIYKSALEKKPDQWYRFPLFGPCIFGCGELELVEKQAHSGLSEEVVGRLVELLQTQKDACVERASKRGVCYEEPPMSEEHVLRILSQEYSGVSPDTEISYESDGSITGGLNFEDVMDRVISEGGYVVRTCKVGEEEFIFTGIEYEWYRNTECTFSRETTGNAVVDKILQKFHWSDLQYDSVEDSVLLSNIVGPLYDFVKECNDWVSSKCLPPSVHLSRKKHFGVTDQNDGISALERCFLVSKPTGLFDCRYPPGRGLEEEIARAR